MNNQPLIYSQIENIRKSKPVAQCNLNGKFYVGTVDIMFAETNGVIVDSLAVEFDWLLGVCLIVDPKIGLIRRSIAGSMRLKPDASWTFEAPFVKEDGDPLTICSSNGCTISLTHVGREVLEINEIRKQYLSSIIRR